MPAASLLVPPALLAAAAALSWGLGLAGARVGRWLAACGAWRALATVESGSALLTALALGACAGLVLLALLQEQARAAPGYWFALTVAALLLLWAAAVLEETGGTSVYSAAPVTAL